MTRTNTTIDAISQELQADVLSIAYDPQTQTGTVSMRTGSCADMDGAVAFFTRLDPACICIRTFSGRRPDTVYWRDVNGWWPLGDCGQVGRLVIPNPAGSDSE